MNSGRHLTRGSKGGLGPGGDLVGGGWPRHPQSCDVPNPTHVSGLVHRPQTDVPKLPSTEHMISYSVPLTTASLIY